MTKKKVGKPFSRSIIVRFDREQNTMLKELVELLPKILKKPRYKADSVSRNMKIAEIVRLALKNLHEEQTHAKR